MYSLIRNPWVIIPIEILHGPTLGLCWPTMVSYGDKVAPSGTKATIQGLVGAIFEGIGKNLSLIKLYQNIKLLVDQRCFIWKFNMWVFNG